MQLADAVAVQHDLVALDRDIDLSRSEVVRLEFLLQRFRLGLVVIVVAEAQLLADAFHEVKHSHRWGTPLAVALPAELASKWSGWKAKSRNFAGRTQLSAGDGLFFSARPISERPLLFH